MAWVLPRPLQGCGTQALRESTDVKITPQSSMASSMYNEGVEGEDEKSRLFCRLMVHSEEFSRSRQNDRKVNGNV